MQDLLVLWYVRRLSFLALLILTDIFFRLGQNGESLYLSIALLLYTIMLVLVSFDMLRKGTETAGSIDDNRKNTPPIQEE